MEFSSLIQEQRTFFRSGKTLSEESRRMRLDLLRQAIEQNEEKILAALNKDLGKGEAEAYVSEIAYVLGEIRFAEKYLEYWIRPSKMRTPMSVMPAKSTIEMMPYGVSLIIGPWNYPFQLLMAPLVSALAAGCCAVLKPSEHAPATAEVVEEILTQHFGKEIVSVVTGGVEVSQALLKEKWDKIFYTGGTEVGRKVMTAAAEHLTPVTLELGGKCPCIVAKDAKIDVAARRIVWGKFMNAGQTCVAPDHVWVDKSVAGKLIDALKIAIRDFYGEDPRQSADYGRIVNEKHHDRLVSLLENETVEVGGQHDRAERYIAPTVLSGVTLDSKVMAEEIFGPILPVLEFESLDEVYADHHERSSPLALYLFTEDKALKKEVVQKTRSGGVCINDTISHLLNRELPFGGVGESGMGSYHGRSGFDAFTHHRSVMDRNSTIDPDMKYPPMTLSWQKLKKLLRLVREI